MAHISPRLVMLTVICLGSAVLLGISSHKDSRDAETMRANGREAIAVITGIHGTRSGDNKISYAIDLAWRDRSGAERRFGATHISDSYAQRIADQGVLITRQTTIRYLEEDQTARPIIMADADERTRQDGIGQVSMVVLGAAGIALAAFIVWRARRTRMHSSA